MKKLALLIAATVLFAASAQAIDSVRTSAGSSVNGKVTAISSTAVTVESSSGAKEIPANDVVSITFENEGTPIKQLRAAAMNGRWEEAQAAIEKLKIDENTRKGIAQDAQFLTAYVAAKLALLGEGEITDAGKMMVEFVNQNPDSYHFFPANEVVGDLLVANRAFGPAENFYAKLAKSPWPEMQMRAKMAIARARVAQKKMAEAAQMYEEVLAMKAEGERADAYRAEATIGKLRSALETGKADDVIQAVEQIINKADADQADVLGPAYNVLGLALKKAGKTKEALMAFLHVDVLYSSAADAHAEALLNLAELFNGLQQTERAVRARRTLEERYPNSPWAQKS